MLDRAVMSRMCSAIRAGQLLLIVDDVPSVATAFSSPRCVQGQAYVRYIGSER